MSDNKTREESGRRRSGKTNYRPWIHMLIRLAIVAAILLIGFLVWNNWEKIAPEALLDWTDQTFGDAQKGEGYPCEISGNAVVDIAEVNQHLVVLNNTTLRFYNANAACVAERTHSFAEPTMHIAGKYVLLTELGGNRIRLDTRRETALEVTLENRRIYAADLLSDGTTALILNSSSQSYVSELEVLNAKGKSKFTYKSNKYLLTDVALSPNGKQLAAIGMTADNGILKSVLLVITLSSNEVKEYTGTDVLLHNVSFFPSGAVLAVGDREIWSLKKNGDAPEKTSCEGMEPVGYAATDDIAGVALRRVGATDDGEVWVFGTDAKRKHVQTYVGEFRSLSAGDDSLLALTDGMLYEIQSDGLQSSTEVQSDCLLATSYRASPILLTLNELKRTEK